MASQQRISRRTVLKTSAVTVSTLPVIGTGTDGTAAGATQDGKTFLELFAGPDRGSFILARGEALGLSDESLPDPRWLPDATISGPEGILAFVPERLADEDGQVRLEDMLLMTSARALDGGLTTEMTGALVPGSQWFPGSKWEPGSGWFPRELFMAEEGVDAMRVFAVPGDPWEPGDEWFPGSRWFPGSKWEPGQSPWWEPPESVEAGASLAELAEEELLLFGAAGHHFNYGRPLAKAWEELAEAETATVLEL